MRTDSHGDPTTDQGNSVIRSGAAAVVSSPAGNSHAQPATRRERSVQRVRLAPAQRRAMGGCSRSKIRLSPPSAVHSRQQAGRTGAEVPRELSCTFLLVVTVPPSQKLALCLLDLPVGRIAACRELLSQPLNLPLQFSRASPATPASRQVRHNGSLLFVRQLVVEIGQQGFAIAVFLRHCVSFSACPAKARPDCHYAQEV